MLEDDLAVSTSGLKEEPGVTMSSSPIFELFIFSETTNPAPSVALGGISAH